MHWDVGRVVHELNAWVWHHVGVWTGCTRGELHVCLHCRRVLLLTLEVLLLPSLALLWAAMMAFHAPWHVTTSLHDAASLRQAALHATLIASMVVAMVVALA